MTFRLLEGPAGSGKTTALFTMLVGELQANPLQEGQAVLAVTKVHGSRRRMEQKLGTVLPPEVAYRCVTLNSFALHLMRRWHSMAETLATSLPDEEDFDSVANVCALLVQVPAVQAWVKASYPVVIVDEMQDLHGGDLRIIKALADVVNLLCAADSFQDLTAAAVCEATEWARSIATCINLTTIRRTTVIALLDAAARLRQGGSIGKVSGKGLKVLAAPKAPVAASFLARNLTWWNGEVALIAACSRSTSKWVDDSVLRLGSGPIGSSGTRFGPFQVFWEATGDQDLARYESSLGLPSSGTIDATEILKKERMLPWPLVDWARSQMRCSGRVVFSCDEVRKRLGHAHAIVRGMGAQAAPRIVGMTVHQAKNREFENVIVLWPVNVGGGLQAQTRLLYNAITRAKRQCLVIVQDPVPNMSRLGLAPFA